MRRDRRQLSPPPTPRHHGAPPPRWAGGGRPGRSRHGQRGRAPEGSSPHSRGAAAARSEAAAPEGLPGDPGRAGRGGQVPGQGGPPEGGCPAASTPQSGGGAAPLRPQRPRPDRPPGGVLGHPPRPRPGAGRGAAERCAAWGNGASGRDLESKKSKPGVGDMPLLSKREKFLPFAKRGHLFSPQVWGLTACSARGYISPLQLGAVVGKRCVEDRGSSPTAVWCKNALFSGSESSRSKPSGGIIVTIKRKS